MQNDESTREPNSESSGEVTVLLGRLAAGEDGVLERVFPLVYDELRRIAKGQRRRSPSAWDSSTLNTTALLHEAYLRFAKGERHLYTHREHFYAVAAKAMRQILIDEARRRLTKKRGGGAQEVSNPTESAAVVEQAEFLLALHQGLDRLGNLEPRARDVVEYRFFGGLSEAETAKVLDVHIRTVRRDWVKARAWFQLELGLGL